MKRSQRGWLITFEGTDGAGKSSLIRAIAKHLKANHPKLGKPVITREPGGSPLAEKIRSLIIKHPMNPWTELFLYEASRAQHLAETLLPALKQGALILCDRYADSSVAYQGFGRGLPLTQVELANLIATQGIRPDLTILIDADPTRTLKSATHANRFEAEGIAFQNRVRKGFKHLARTEPNRFYVVKARSGTPDEMAAPIAEKIGQMILGKNSKTLSELRKSVTPSAKERVLKGQRR